MVFDPIASIALAFTASGALITFGIMYGSLKKEQESFKDAFIDFKEAFADFKEEVKDELKSMRSDIKAIDGRCTFSKGNGGYCERTNRRFSPKHSPEEVSGD